MKTGYSILLGEYIDAIDVDYRDCEFFQIVCPVCYEPLFKVQRRISETAIDYLSHYSADSAYTGDCELRVSVNSRSTYVNENKISRDQRLQFFINVLQDMIGRHEMYTHGTEQAQRLLSRSKALSLLCCQMYENSKNQLNTDAILSDIADEYAKQVEEVGHPLQTTFAYAVQKRIAGDIWKFLLSAKGEANFRFLFNHAYIVLMQRLSTPHQNEPVSTISFMQTMLGFLTKIPQTNKEKGLRIFAEMAATPIGSPYAIEGSNYLNKAASEISHEMMGCLLGLPYFEFLKERFLNKK